MNYKTITIKKTENPREKNKHSEFVCAIDALRTSTCSLPNLIRKSLIPFLLYNIHNSIKQKFNIIGNILVFLASFYGVFVLLLLDSFLFRKDYWDALYNVEYEKELPKNLSKRTHKKIVEQLCQNFGIIEEEEILSNKLADYKTFYQFLRLKEILIFNYQKETGFLDKYGLIDVTEYNIYIDGRLLTEYNMNMLNESDLSIICLGAKKSETKENIKLAEDVLELKDNDWKKKYEIRKLIALLTIQKEALLEASKKSAYQAEYQKLVNEYSDISKISDDSKTILVKVK